MVSHPTDEGRFNWRTEAYAVLAASVFFAAIDLCQQDFSLLLYVFVLAVLFVSGIALLIYAAISKNHRRQSRRQLKTVALFCTIALSLFAFGRAYPIAIRSVARWLLRSHDYKIQVLAQPQLPNGEFKHVEWDGWGMFAQNTTVYLVFDPTDSLSGAARSHQAGKFN